jgi:carbon storage regulator
MLVLTRRYGEVIVIGGQDGEPAIEVMVVRIRDDEVRIGVKAPEGVKIDRSEIRELREGETK